MEINLAPIHTYSTHKEKQVFSWNSKQSKEKTELIEYR